MTTRTTRLRSVAALATAAALVGGLAACSADTGSSVIRVSTPYDDYWGEPLRVAAAEYEKQHPGVTVEVEGIPYEDYQSTYQTQLVGGSAADLLFLEPPAVAEFAGREFLEPLDSYLDADGGAWASVFNDGILDANRAADGNQYAAPWSSVAVVVAYHDAVYQELGAGAPETWDEWMDINADLVDAGQVPLTVSLKGDDAQIWWLLTNKLNAIFRPLVPEINLIHADGWEFDPNDLTSTAGESYTADELYVAFKKGLIDPAVSEGYRVAAEQVAEMIPFLNDDTGSTVPTEVNSRFAASEVPQIITLGLVLANVANEIAASGGTSDVRSFNLPTITEDNYPGLTAGGENPLSGLRNSFSVNAAAANKEGAIDFLKFITTPEIATLMYSVQAQGDASAIKGVEYPADSVIVEGSAQKYAEINAYGFGGAPTFDAQDADEFNAQLQQLMTGASTIDQFLAARSASNLAALERNLVLNADTIDQAFIDEQLGN